MSHPDALVSFTVPGPPRGKAARRAVAVYSPTKGRHTVRTFPDSKTSSEMGAIRLIASVAMRGQPPLDGPLCVVVAAYMPIPRSFSRKKQAAAEAGLIWPTVKPDYDNVAKILDAVKGVAFRDDALIVRALIDKVYARTPRLEVTFRRRTPDQAQGAA